MELRWLTAFVAVAEELSYRRAAERLFVAQPAISQQIMNLEKELGVRLFDRNNRSVRLTDAGAAFLPSCRAALDAVQRAGLSARNAGTGEYGRIRIGFNAGFTTNHLVTLVQVLRSEHPHLELTIDTSRRTPEIVRMVREERLDIGLVGGPVQGSGVEQRTIATTRLGVLVLVEHPLARSNPVSIQALRNEGLILLEPAPGWSIRRFVEDAFDRAGVPPREVTTVGDPMTMLAFVAAGIGVGFASLNTDATTPRRLALVPLADGPDIPTSVVWKAGSETPALNTVIRAAERHLPGDAARPAT